MADPHIITALRAKRAELAGDLGMAEARVQRLQAETVAVDTTLRLFDPSQRPATIRPAVKGTKPARFGRGSLRGPSWGCSKRRQRP